MTWTESSYSLVTITKLLLKQSLVIKKQFELEDWVRTWWSYPRSGKLLLHASMPSNCPEMKMILTMPLRWGLTRSSTQVCAPTSPLSSIRPTWYLRVLIEANPILLQALLIRLQGLPILIIFLFSSPSYILPREVPILQVLLPTAASIPPPVYPTSHQALRTLQTTLVLATLHLLPNTAQFLLPTPPPLQIKPTQLTLATCQALPRTLLLHQSTPQFHHNTLLLLL